MSLISRGILDKATALSPFINCKYFLQAPSAILQTRTYAARKGTRDKRAKNKVKVEVQKVGFIPHNQRDLEKFLLNRPKRKFDDSWKQLPVDNVYPRKYYQWQVYPFKEALKCHQETHHPDIYNQPNAKLNVTIELNMEGEKKTKFVDNFSRIVAVPHKFDHGEVRSIIAFSKDQKVQESAKEAGALLTGGLELIKEIQNGNVLLSDFQFIVADPEMLADLVVLRGLMKRRFPNIKAGTLDVDIPNMVSRFLNGISYSAVRDEYEKDYGSIDTVIGNLNMDSQHLEDNFASLVQDVISVKPKRAGPFITRCLLWCPPSSVKCKVDHNLYIKETSKPVSEDTPEDDVQEKQAVAA